MKSKDKRTKARGTVEGTSEPAFGQTTTPEKTDMATPPEVEATLARLHSHRNVKGLLILSSETGKVIRYSGAMLEEGAASGTASAGNGNGDDTISNGARREASSDSASAVPEPAAVAGGASGSSAGPSIHPTVKRYADAVRRIVENSRLGVEELDDQVSTSQLLIVRYSRASAWCLQIQLRGVDLTC